MDYRPIDSLASSLQGECHMIYRPPGHRIEIFSENTANYFNSFNIADYIRKGKESDNQSVRLAYVLNLKKIKEAYHSIPGGQILNIS